MHKKIGLIKTKKDFLDFLSSLIKDLDKNKSSWTNKNLESYLEGVESWVEDMEGYYENMNIQLPEDISWRVFADILYAAKIYE
jgi:hypothetical protein